MADVSTKALTYVVSGERRGDTVRGEAMRDAIGEGQARREGVAVMELRRTTRIGAPVEVCFRLSLTIDMEVQAGREFGLRAVDGVTTG